MDEEVEVVEATLCTLDWVLVACEIVELAIVVCEIAVDVDAENEDDAGGTWTGEGSGSSSVSPSPCLATAIRASSKNKNLWMNCIDCECINSMSLCKKNCALSSLIQIKKSLTILSVEHLENGMRQTLTGAVEGCVGANSTQQGNKLRRMLPFVMRIVPDSIVCKSSGAGADRFGGKTKGATWERKHTQLAYREKTLCNQYRFIKIVHRDMGKRPRPTGWAQCN